MKKLTERELENELRKHMKSIKGMCLKFVSPSNNGVPDRIVIFPNGHLIFVEMKGMHKSKLSPIQEEMISRMQNLNQDIFQIWSWKDLADFFKIYGHRKIGEKIIEKYGV